MAFGDEDGRGESGFGGECGGRVRGVVGGVHHSEG